MRSLIVGDLHLNDNPRDAYRHDFQKHLLRVVRDERPDRVIFVGDFTDAKDQHRAWLVNRIAGYFDRIARECDVYALMGNHDYLDPEHPFFAFLSHIPGIHWISRPKTIDDWLFLPHTRDYERDWDGLDLDRPSMIITHNTFAGADNGFGKKLRGIPPEVIPKDTVVIAGDVHVPQRERNICYVGAPYTVHFGDTYQPRMLLVEESMIIDLDCPGPQKRVVECSAKDDTNPKTGNYLYDIPKKYDDILDEGDILEVRVHIQMKHVAHWQAMRRAIRETLEHAGHFIVTTIKPIVSRDVESKRGKLDKHKRLSDRELVQRYGKAFDENTLKVGLALMDK